LTPRPSLAEPGDLRGFPWSAPPKRLVRVCRAGASTWWFSSGGEGRFDLAPPEGTCYLATDAYAAIREASRLGPVSTDWVVTVELVTLVPYDRPRRWAAAFRAHGFDGVRHQLRHDQRARPSGVALFGAAGAADLPDGTGRRLTRDAMEAAGVKVMAPPGAAALTVVD